MEEGPKDNSERDGSAATTSPLPNEEAASNAPLQKVSTAVDTVGLGTNTPATISDNKNNNVVLSNTKPEASGQTLGQIIQAHTEQQVIAAHFAADRRVGLLPTAAEGTCTSTSAGAGATGIGNAGGSKVAGQLDHMMHPNAAIATGTSSEIRATAAAAVTAPPAAPTEADNDTTPTTSVRSIGSLVCRICHNSEDPEKLVSPWLCKGSLTYVHVHCLERWISTSRSTVCELCQFQYNTIQTLRYTCLQSLRMWYSRSMSRRALQEDCQMFSLLTLVAFGIIGTLLVGIQYYILQGRTWGLGRLWTKGWLIFFLLTTLIVYFVNIYMIVRSQLTPWYRWWQSARDIKLILENRKPFQISAARRLLGQQVAENLSQEMTPQLQPQPQPQPQSQQQSQTQQMSAEQMPTSLPPTSTNVAYFTHASSYGHSYSSPPFLVPSIIVQPQTTDDESFRKQLPPKAASAFATAMTAATANVGIPMVPMGSMGNWCHALNPPC